MRVQGSSVPRYDVHLQRFPGMFPTDCEEVRAEARGPVRILEKSSGKEMRCLGYGRSRGDGEK